MRTLASRLAALAACLLALPAIAVTPPLHTVMVPYVSGLSSPVDIVTPPDSSGRMFVVQQGGQIRIIENGALVATPFLSLSGSVITSGGERGLLSLAFHPNYASNGYFYVYYTRASDAALTIARYSRSAGDPRVADPASGQVLLNIPHSTYANHNGGKLAFGPDGYLYSTHGDGGSGDDPLNSGQTLSTLLGKLLRIDVDNGSPYSIPPDNPFVGVSGAAPEIFAYGLRNVWRMSFDRLTGDLFIGDVGQGQREEIDFIPAGSAGGQNFGWRVWEGTRCNTSVATTQQCAALAQTPPILEYDHTANGAGTGACGGSVTGGVRYRGSAIPALYGRYVFADYCTGRMWTAIPTGGAMWERATLADTGLNIAGFGEDAAGEVYFAAGGTIYKLVAEEAQASFQGDASGDARADLVWQNATTGTTAMWLMNGTAPTSTMVLLANSGWRVTHLADFNGDGKLDLVWRNAITGETALWLMNGTAALASVMISTNPAVVVTQAADFNGDGRADLVLRNSLTGETSLWLMNGTAVTSAATVMQDPAWMVTHTADLNGDGKADLVWRNAAAGQNAVWLMNGTAATAVAAISSDRNWYVTHTGDLDGDGKADLVWRNLVTGATAAWLMNGTAIKSAATLLTDRDWSVVRLADTSGDGKADIVWRNRVSGATALWTMSGTTATATAVIYGSAAWRVTHAGDFNGDGRADLVWRNAGSGQTAIWTMNGTTVTSSAVVFGDGQWAVADVNAAP
ncbi:MAG: PQQ-dependent sugar dehydrogenase [Burkholderiales bacterium]